MKEYTIYSHTAVNVPTLEFKGKTPYMMALAMDENGEKFLTRINDYKDGMKVSVGDKIYFESEDAEGNIICKYNK